MSTIVGKQLRQARESRSLTLEQVAQATRIRAHYLQFMEAGEFDKVPSVAQARGFLRAYAGFLDMEPTLLLAELNGEAITQTSTPPTVTTRRSDDPSAGESKLVEEIFIDIGKQLKQQRELLDLSLDDVERHTHLRMHYLIAMEAGDIEGLPSPVQGRGMLNNFATFLGLDPEPIMLKFADGLQASLAARQAAKPKARKPTTRSKRSQPSKLRRLFSGDIVIGATLAIFLVSFMLWGAIRIFAVNTEQTSTPTAPSIVDVLLASATPTITLTPEMSTPTNPASLAGFTTPVIATDAITGNTLSENASQVQVYVTVLERAWMRVSVDGEIAFEGRVIPGSAYPFVGDSQVEILTGNGAALRILFNNFDMGTMGSFGQIVNQIYSLQGVVTPTPIPSLTATATAPETATQVSTITSEPGQGTVPPIP